MVELLDHPSIQRHCCVAIDIVAPPPPSPLSWMDPIISFIADGTLPSDSKETKKVQRKSTRFWLSGKKTYINGSLGGMLT